MCSSFSWLKCFLWVQTQVDAKVSTITLTGHAEKVVQTEEQSSLCVSIILFEFSKHVQVQYVTEQFYHLVCLKYTDAAFERVFLPNINMAIILIPSFHLNTLITIVVTITKQFMLRRTSSAWYRVSCYLWGPTWKHRWGEGSLIQIYLTVNHVTCVSLSMAVQTQTYTVWHMKPLPHTLHMHCVRLPPRQGVVFCNPFTTASIHYTRAVFVRTLSLLTFAGFTAEDDLLPFWGPSTDENQAGVFKWLDKKQCVGYGTFIVFPVHPVPLVPHVSSATCFQAHR